MTKNVFLFIYQSFKAIECNDTMYESIVQMLNNLPNQSVKIEQKYLKQERDPIKIECDVNTIDDKKDINYTQNKTQEIVSLPSVKESLAETLLKTYQDESIMYNLV